jgi:hypothetical protein
LTTDENNHISILKLIFSFITERDLSNILLYGFEERIAAIFKFKSNTLHHIESRSDIKKPKIDVHTRED